MACCQAQNGLTGVRGPECGYMHPSLLSVLDDNSCLLTEPDLV